ncbi:unnamed protein product [Calypogeia fissa]
MSAVAVAVLHRRGDDGASDVTENNSAMSVDNVGVTSQQHAQHRDQVYNIPFEFVDDDELAAIETAMLRAHSISSVYHSVTSQYVDIPPVLPGAISGNPYLSHNSATNVGIKPETSFVYTVVSASGSTLESSARSRAPNGSVSSIVASPGHSRAQQDSPCSGFKEVCSSQLSVEMCTSQLEEGRETLSDDYIPPVLSVSDESSPHLLVNTTTLSLVSETFDQGRGFGDSQDIEDFYGANSKVSTDDGSSASSKETGRRVNVTLLQRKSGRGLSVTDFTASEWCEKQVEFSLNRGKPEQTPAMKAGSARHLELEKEVVTRVEIEIFTKEDTWAVRLLNFIGGARQLLSEGLTRELPVVGLVGATWVVGFIDEIRLVQTECGERPLLVDTKTRKRRFPPSEPQKRNARLQLMCYKLLWDTMVKDGLPLELFFKHFRLNPRQEFCQDVKTHASSFWIDCKVQCLQDLLAQIMNDIKSQIYSKSVDSLLLRYEWQEDHSLLGEDEFLYEHDWLMDRWNWHSEFWSGNRVASFVPEDEAWKCRYCSFAKVCLASQQSTGEDMQKDRKEDMKEHKKEDKEQDKDDIPGQGPAA